jgi:hypothetical protein
MLKDVVILRKSPPLLLLAHDVSFFLLLCRTPTGIGLPTNPTIAFFRFRSFPGMSLYCPPNLVSSEARFWRGCKGPLRFNLALNYSLGLSQVVVSSRSHFDDGAVPPEAVCVCSYRGFVPPRRCRRAGSTLSRRQPPSGALLLRRKWWGLQLRRVPTTVHVGHQPDRRVNVFFCPSVCVGKEPLECLPPALSAASFGNITFRQRSRCQAWP